GAPGTVWRPIAGATGGRVGAKFLRRALTRQPKAVTRFVQERAILLMLRHPHIVRVRDLLTVGDSLGLVMDLVSGGSLRDHLVDRGTLAPGPAAASAPAAAVSVEVSLPGVQAGGRVQVYGPCSAPTAGAWTPATRCWP